jgi:tripartite-type tricarboxylate transporter receptor subunit TctC
VLVPRLTRLVALSILFQLSCALHAQTFPAKPVRYIVPSTAGSGADVVARVLAGGMSSLFGQQVIVDNRAGAGGNIGSEFAARSQADGYTVLQITLTQAVNATLYRKLPYDVLRDFTAVTQLATSPSMIVVHPSLPVKSIGELVKLAKAKPGAINFASAGTGTPTFLAAEVFKGMAGVNLVHVAYRGGSEAMNSVVSGETSVYFPSVSVAMPLVQQGRLRVLAVTTAQRLPSLPQYPTVAELGYPRYQAGNWYGIVVPVKTPASAISRIHEAAVTALNEPATTKRLADLGLVAVGNKPEEFEAFIKAEVLAVGKIIKELGLTAD